MTSAVANFFQFVSFWVRSEEKTFFLIPPIREKCEKDVEAVKVVQLTIQVFTRDSDSTNISFSNAPTYPSLSLSLLARSAVTKLASHYGQGPLQLSGLADV